ncbi:outer membrane protein, partial [Helicobacter pylori]
MNKLLLAFFLSVYLRADDLVTYTIIKKEDLGFQR